MGAADYFLGIKCDSKAFIHIMKKVDNLSSLREKFECLIFQTLQRTNLPITHLENQHDTSKFEAIKPPDFSITYKSYKDSFKIYITRSEIQAYKFDLVLPSSAPKSPLPVMETTIWL